MFFRRSTECRGPTLEHDRHHCSPTVHSVDQSFSSTSREIGAASHCLPRKFSSSSSQITSILSTINTNQQPLSVRWLSVGCWRPPATQDSARSSVHRVMHHVRGRAAPRRLVLRVLRAYVYIRERVCSLDVYARACKLDVYSRIRGSVFPPVYVCLARLLRVRARK